MNDSEAIRAEIAQARQELGDTVAAVAEKTDVKQHAHEKAESLKGRASAKARENPVPLALVGILLVLFVLRRRRSR